jgi:hypothetical protein
MLYPPLTCGGGAADTLTSAVRTDKQDAPTWFYIARPNFDTLHSLFTLSLQIGLRNVSAVTQKTLLGARCDQLAVLNARRPAARSYTRMQSLLQPGLWFTATLILIHSPDQ